MADLLSGTHHESLRDSGQAKCDGALVSRMALIGSQGRKPEWAPAAEAKLNR
jgi:hypothetical protein